jgi:hypothetical protein
MRISCCRLNSPRARLRGGILSREDLIRIQGFGLIEWDGKLWVSVELLLVDKESETSARVLAMAVFPAFLGPTKNIVSFCVIDNAILVVVDSIHWIGGEN